MTEHARHRDDPADIYLFLHSKGVTHPPTRQRRHLSYFVSRGFDPSGSNDAANAFVLEDTATVVSNWREYVKALETTSSFWYYIYNFFWVSGDLLRQFDFDEYLRLHRELAPPQQRPHRLGSHWDKTRHLFSLFPIKLYAFRNGLELDAPPYTYVDVRMLIHPQRAARQSHSAAAPDRCRSVSTRARGERSGDHGVPGWPLPPTRCRTRRGTAQSFVRTGAGLASLQSVPAPSDARARRRRIDRAGREGPSSVQRKSAG